MSKHTDATTRVFSVSVWVCVSMCVRMDMNIIHIYIPYDVFDSN